MNGDNPRVPPLVSLFLAAYNEERYIEACLNSLRAQTWPAVEIVFVDDSSTDRTRELVEKFPGIRVLDQPHLGKAPAMNLAARNARGDIPFFMDGDIEYSPDYVEQMVAPILSGAEIGSAHGLEKEPIRKTRGRPVGSGLQKCPPISVSARIPRSFPKEAACSVRYAATRFCR